VADGGSGGVADSGTYMLVSGLVGSAVTALLGGIGALLAQRAKARREDKADEFGRMNAVIDRLEKQTGSQQMQLDRALVAEAKCREDMARVGTAYTFLYGVVKNQHSSLVKAGIPVDPLPHMPDIRLTAAQDVAEFVMRATKHNTGIVRQEVREVRARAGDGPQQPAGGGSSPPGNAPPTDAPDTGGSL
jgi:hypothetical protein